MSGVDGVTMAADGAGNVVAFWHVMNNPPPDVAVIVRLKGDSQLIGIQAPGFDEGAEGRDEIIPPMWRTVCFSRSFAIDLSRFSFTLNFTILLMRP